MKDGGPAFPTDNGRQTGANDYHYEGMTLRAWFAGQALAGFCATASYADCHYAVLANMAVRQADALIKELDK